LKAKFNNIDKYSGYKLKDFETYRGGIKNEKQI